MVFPSILTSADGLGSLSQDYTWSHTDPAGFEYYVYDNRSKYGIKVITDINSPDYNKWFDGSTLSWPNLVVEETINGVLHIALYNGGEFLFRFVKPTVADWISTGPPPNTNSVSDAFVSYLVDDNELRVYIPLDKPSTFFHPNPDPPNRDLYYQLRNVSVSGISLIVHTEGTPTNETIVPTTAGIYQLESVQTNPTTYTTYDTAEVTQAQLDFYATNNPPENDPPSSPVFVPPVFIRGSSRRGNLNFW